LCDSCLLLKRIDKNQSESPKGGLEKGGYKDVSEQYNVPAEYFTRLAHIHDQCPDEDTWIAIQRSILDREASIPALVAGLAGRGATAGKKRKDANYQKLMRPSATSFFNVLRNWQTFDAPHKAGLAEFFPKIVSAIPRDLQGKLTEGIHQWSIQERELIIGDLRRQLDADKKRKS
jgi:hypothetical protein